MPSQISLSESFLGDTPVKEENREIYGNLVLASALENWPAMAEVPGSHESVLVLLLLWVQQTAGATCPPWLNSIKNHQKHLWFNPPVCAWKGCPEVWCGFALALAMWPQRQKPRTDWWATCHHSTWKLSRLWAPTFNACSTSSDACP